MTHVLAAGTNTDLIARETLFWILAVASVGAALAMILVRRAVHCAIMLAVVMLCLATMYAMQGAPFLAFVQIIVYTGAVLMLFLFVVMLIGISSADSIVETIKGQRLAAGLAAIGLLVLLILGIGHAAIGPAAPPTAANGANNLSGLAALIFTTYVFPFEVTSALLITAALGAMVLAHRERTAPKPTQRELAAGGWPAASWRPTRRPGSTRCTTPRTCRPCCRTARTSDLSVSPVLSQREVTEHAAVRPEETLAITAESGEREPEPFEAGSVRAEGRATREPRALRGPVRDPVRDRRGRRARPAQRDRDLHVRRADAERVQPGVRRVRQHARQPGRAGRRVLRDGGRGRRGRRRASRS